MTASRILVADDDPFLRDLVRQKLGALGYQVFLARDGREAVIRAHENRPDLIVLDMLMPEMDGMEALARIKVDPELAHIPVLMLTALRSENDVRGAMALGASGYIAKPFQLDSFCARVSHLLSAAAKPVPPPSKVQYLG